MSPRGDIIVCLLIVTRISPSSSLAGLLSFTVCTHCNNTEVNIGPQDLNPQLQLFEDMGTSEILQFTAVTMANEILIKMKINKYVLQ